MKLKLIFMLALGILMIGTTLYLYPTLPDKIPTHWEASGIADNYQDKSHIYMPIALYFLSFVFIAMFRFLDPKKKNYDKSKSAMNTVQTLLGFFSFAIWLFTLFEVYYEGQFDNRYLLYPLTGCIFIFFGNVMPKIKANYFVGLRTPWTLANEEVWYLSHRFCGKVWFFGGWIYMLIGFLIPASWNSTYITISMLCLVVPPILYSYLCFKKLFKLPKSRNDEQ